MCCRSSLLGIALMCAATSNAHATDMSQLSCPAFFATGHDNVAAMIMWLRGYHAGKTGAATLADSADMKSFGTALGTYCKEHPDSSILGASEHVLTDH
jgi:hypothetical protein